ncbi:unnamed protein product [Ilex paraguariensis]|uniref:C3H1-type domain-containing protein n=1 Tax=Ilex paraguariensis TaxID=185542 RepID=A0ABC8TF65_9AQUA
MAEYLVRIFGVKCPFYFKIGACRHGDRCWRLHTKLSIIPTLRHVSAPGDDRSSQNSRILMKICLRS